MDRGHLEAVLAAERAVYAERNPRSRAAHGRADHLLGRVPMTWMGKSPGGFPLYLAGASGARVTDLDGHELVDFCLGDSGAMAGHSPGPVIEAVHRRLAVDGGATAMLPTDDAELVAAELTRRFGVSRWSFSLSATDANRWALRLGRVLTGRPVVAVHSHCYHGSVDEAFVVSTPDGTRPRPGTQGGPGEVTAYGRAVEFNDLTGLEAALAPGDVAALLMEPALTNIGIVRPEPGYLEGVRELTRAAGTLLVIDETHTLSAGPGGATAAWGLDPDIVTLGKSIGGGLPAGAYGLAGPLAERVAAFAEADLIDAGGVGGTLAGNALSVAAMRATLAEVLTDEAFGPMIALADRYSAGIESVIEAHDLPWSMSRLGARAEYAFTRPAPRTGGEGAAAVDPLLEDVLHLYLLNRGVLLTPFHNMALMCPATTAADVDRHLEVFAAAVAELTAV